ncbi:MAG: DUF445 family protein [Candidatus Sericytochromatia bacterium]
MADDTALMLYTFIRPFFQPLIGAFHGWFATRMVVVMLFRPYKAYYLPGTEIKVPFTPGIFPSRKRALAENIARTVTQTLLTPEDIQARTDNIVTEANLSRGVDMILETVLEGFSQTDKLEMLATELKRQVPGMLDSTAQNLIQNLTARDSKLLEKLVDSVVLDGLMRFRLSGNEARELVDYAFRNFFAPVQIRAALQTALTPQRAHNLQQILLGRTTGPLRFILNFVNVEGIFVNFKDYLEKEPEKSESLIEEFIYQLQLKEELTNQMMNLDLSQLPPEDLETLRTNIKTGVRHYLIDQRERIEGALSHFEGVLGDSIYQKVLGFTPEHLDPRLKDMIKTEVTRFLTRYLKSDLSRLVQKGIALIRPDEMIITKIEAYSSADIENLILGIMRRELKNLELLGLLIGLLLGISALGIEFFLPIRH